ncbi:MFS transporter [Gracilibacillus sp. S3-1-1]|uniref:MFS transporter n=1 Tax=Gracilibacillus pellucidus TaxID=3095368 RepID=A0ACC6M8I1_9BACI|nr:MFS transporter [Gracilibacillus sp. S3-1-1]MDX8047249.1 MFS transporter [Gracilibacillus sp. S3-1-1]
MSNYKSTKHEQSKWWALIALTLAAVMVGLDMTILNIALPTLSVTFDASTNQLQWFINSYTLALAVFMLPAGLLGDRFGRKKMLICVFIMFAASSLLCAFATNAELFIIGRVLLGIAAAFVITLSTAILPVIFSVGERSKAVSILMIGTMLSLPIGPLLGGWILDYLWWGWIFLLNIPIIMLASIAVILFLPESRGEQKSRVDFVGILLSGIGLFCVSYGTIEAGARGWDNSLTLLTLITGFFLVGLFALWQYKTRYPLIDMTIFRTPVFRWSMVLSILVNILLFGMLFIIPLYYQVVIKTDAFGSGLRLLFLVAGLVIGGILTEISVAKFGEKKIIVSGFFLIALATIVGANTTIDSTEWFVGTWLAVFGLGMGLAMPTVMNLALGALLSKQSGIGSSVIQTGRQVGGALGVAIFGSILNSGYRSNLQLEQFPNEVRGVVQESVAAGAVVVENLTIPELLDNLYQSFIMGMNNVLWICFAIAIFGIMVSFIFLPASIEEDEIYVHKEGESIGR